ncbi:MAG TPA: reverse transcriptase-like protein [Candidatus Avamphibacillus sp.]|nr:reverse transcriptase-like protein [Candidatus Avamphibacillus sp.]
MNVMIVLTYQTVKGTEMTLYSNEMQAKKAIVLVEDLEKTGRIKSMFFSDRHDNRWTLKQLKAYMEDIQTEAHNVTVYFDGGFHLNSKKAGLGCAVYYTKNEKLYRLRKNALVEELHTNNEAEYAALYLGLQELIHLDVHHLPVTFIGDSKVVINQLNDEWPCYELELSKWIDRIEQSMKQIGINPEYKLISRKMNREADQLATQALNGIEIMSTKEL